MTARPSSEITETPLSRDILYAARHYPGRQRSLIILADIALVARIGFNGSCRVASDIASLLLTVLPCLAMRALGLCMNSADRRSGSSEPTSERTIEKLAGAALAVVPAVSVPVMVDCRDDGLGHLTSATLEPETG